MTQTDPENKRSEEAREHEHAENNRDLEELEANFNEKNSNDAKENSYQPDHEKSVSNDVVVKNGALKVVKKNADGAQSRRFDLIRVDHPMKNGADFRRVIIANQMKILPLKAFEKI